MNREAIYNNTYQAILKSGPPSRVVRETSAADIINPGRGFMSAFDFTMQWQVGCLFCYVIASRMVVSPAVRGNQGETWGFAVREKIDVISKLITHLQQGTLADKTIYWSGVTDPYAAPPALTREFWKVLLQTPQALRPRRIAVQTRFRPDRDVALIQQYNHTTITTDGGPTVVVSYSVGTDRNDLIAAWERATPLFEQRLHAIYALRQAGVFVVTTFSPLALWHDLSGALTQFQTWVCNMSPAWFSKNTPVSQIRLHNF